MVVDRAPWVAGITVRLRVAREELDVRRAVKQAGGQWDAAAGLWRLPLGAVRRLGLASQVAADGGE